MPHQTSDLRIGKDDRALPVPDQATPPALAYALKLAPAGGVPVGGFNNMLPPAR